MNYFNETKMQETEITKGYESNMNMNMGGNSCMYNDPGMMATPMMGCPQAPIYECPQERVCHRYVCYEVPHIQPCNTRIITHHIYKHTFNPVYTCCEENVCENVFEPRCC